MESIKAFQEWVADKGVSVTLDDAWQAAWDRAIAALSAGEAQQGKMESDAREDLADRVSKAMSHAWSYGQTYWQQADSEYASQNRKSETTQAKYQALVDETRAAVLATPSPRQMVADSAGEAAACKECGGTGWKFSGQDMNSPTVHCDACAAQPPAAAEAENLAKLRKQIAAIPDRIEAISGQHFSYIKRAEVLDTIDAAMQKEVHDGME